MESKKEEYDTKKLSAGIKLFLYVALIVGVIIYTVNDKNTIDKNTDVLFDISVLNSLKDNNYICNIDVNKNEDNLSMVTYKDSIVSQFIKKNNLNILSYYVIRDGESYLFDVLNEEVSEDNLEEIDKSVIYDDFDDFYLNTNQIINIINNVAYEEDSKENHYSLSFNTCDVIKYYNESFSSSFICNEESKIIFEIDVFEEDISIKIDASSFYSVIDKTKYDKYYFNMSFDEIGNISESDYANLIEKDFDE